MSCSRAKVSELPLGFFSVTDHTVLLPLHCPHSSRRIRTRFRHGPFAFAAVTGRHGWQTPNF
jgi:hypothetical protein